MACARTEGGPLCCVTALQLQERTLTRTSRTDCPPPQTPQALLPEVPKSPIISPLCYRSHLLTDVPASSVPSVYSQHSEPFPNSSQTTLPPQVPPTGLRQRKSPEYSCPAHPPCSPPTALPHPQTSLPDAALPYLPSSSHKATLALLLPGVFFL